MGDLLQFTLTGMTIGSIYAIVALGFVTIYSVTKVINLAQGEFVMLGGLTMYSLSSAGMPYWLGFIVTIIFVSIIGWGMEFVLIRRAKGSKCYQSDYINDWNGHIYSWNCKYHLGEGSITCCPVHGK